MGIVYCLTNTTNDKKYLKDTCKHFDCSEATIIRNLRKYSISKKNISK